MSDVPQDASSALSYDAPLNFEDLLQKLCKKFTQVPLKTIENFRFGFDGLVFSVVRADQENNHRFLLKTTIGFMPFSIESAERRIAIQTIIFGSRSLPNVRFGIDMSGKISAGAIIDVADVASPDFLFYPLSLFMQESRPFIQLIGKYLSSWEPSSGHA